MWKKGKITVVLTIYNRSAVYIRKSIKAILEQNLKDFDFYIINNGSTDISCEQTIKEFNDKRIKYIKWDKNMYICDLDKMVHDIIHIGDSEYIIWTHDDDMMRKNMLLREKQILDENSNIAMVAPQVQIIDADDNNTECKSIEHDVIYKQYEYISKLCSENLDYDFSSPAILFRRKYLIEATEKIKNMGLEIGDSVDLLWKFCINTYNCEMYITKEVLYEYRVHKMQETIRNKSNGIDYVRNNVYKFLDIMNAKSGGRICGIDLYKKRYDLFYERLCIANRIDGYIRKNVNEDKISFIKMRCENNKSKFINQIDSGMFSEIYLRAGYLASRKDIKKYVIWGTGKGALHAKLVLDYILPELECVGYIDTYKDGYLNGLKIYKPEQYDFDSSYYIIIAATTAEAKISALLDSKGLIEMKDYLTQFLYM